MCRIWWFGYRVESPGCQTAKLANIVSLQFGYRDESPGRQTFHHGPDLHIPFGYRVVSPGSQSAVNIMSNGTKFGCRADPPGSQSKYRPAGLFFPFGYRVDSPGSRPTMPLTALGRLFGYRVDSPGSRPIADEPAGQVPNRALETGEITPVFLLQRPRTGGFPVRCGSPQAWISALNGGMLAFARRAYDTAAVLFRQRARSSRPGRRLPISVSC